MAATSQEGDASNITIKGGNGYPLAANGIDADV